MSDAEKLPGMQACMLDMARASHVVPEKAKHRNNTRPAAYQMQEL